MNEMKATNIVMKRITQIAIPFALFALMLTGCDRSAGPASQGHLTMYMVDAPASYDAVNINVKEVSVHSATEGWIVVNSTPRVFNLLDLTNGAMAVLGDVALDAGKYTQIRLLLESGSAVVIDGVEHELFVPSGLQTGVKLVHNFDIEEGTRYDLVLDFDAARSVVQTANTYILKPTIRVKALALTGSVEGVVQPASASPLITAVVGTDTATTYGASNGSFKLVGLDPGTYVVTVQATAGSYRDTTFANVQVSAGSTRHLGTIVLQEE
jgi:hypothetical protein